MTTELRRLRNYINGEFRDAADGRTIEVVNPATGEVYATSPPSPPGVTAPPPSARRYSSRSPTPSRSAPRT